MIEGYKKCDTCFNCSYSRKVFLDNVDVFKLLEEFEGYFLFCSFEGADEEVSRFGYCPNFFNLNSLSDINCK